MRRFGYLFLILAVVLVACGRVSVPEQYTQDNSFPGIYPDYVGVTVPVNIAPLTFEMNNGGDIVARLSYGTDEMVCGGRAACPEPGEWRELLAKAQGHDIQVEVYGEDNGKWVRYKPFTITVSPDSIDSYLSYRLISPSYVTYEELTINQRCLEDYDESVIYDNML